MSFFGERIVASVFFARKEHHIPLPIDGVVFRRAVVPAVSLECHKK